MQHIIDGTDYALTRLLDCKALWAGAMLCYVHHGKTILRSYFLKKELPFKIYCLASNGKGILLEENVSEEKGLGHSSIPTYAEENPSVQ